MENFELPQQVKIDTTAPAWELPYYDPETDTLTIKGTPPNLKDQLTRRLGSSES